VLFAVLPQKYREEIHLGLEKMRERNIGWRHTAEFVHIPKVRYLPERRPERFDQCFMNFANLFRFHISKEKIHIGRKPEFESESQDENPQKYYHRQFKSFQP
jgi:hypothetical protein